MNRVDFIRPVHLEYDDLAFFSANFEEISRSINTKCRKIDVVDTLADEFYLLPEESNFFENLSRCFGALRRNRSIFIELPMPDRIDAMGLNEASCTFIILASGNCIILFSGKIENEDNYEKTSVGKFIDTAFPFIMSELKKVFKKSSIWNRLRFALTIQTPTHRVFFFEARDTAFVRFAKEVFNREGLELVIDDSDFSFCSGWSNSVFFGTEMVKYCQFLTLMIRFQSYWYQLRRTREDTIKEHGSIFRKPDFKRTEKFRKKTNFEIFQIQYAKQTMADFHANIKPWLKPYSTKVSEMWALEEDYEAIMTTLERQREFTQFMLFDESLFQNRIQSFLLYFIAALDTLAISALALTIFSFERSSSDLGIDFLSSIPNSAINYLLAANIVLLIIVLSIGFLRRFFK